MIIAMAGHVDHGKTSLVRALTGIETDRLPDEKQRGMTIDLGFAHAEVPGGGTVGFVDVPGHERFLTNMLAGVLSVDSVLLVVAADDGPMPQTDEHLAILRLTGLTDVTAVITKIDRVDAGRTDEVVGMVRTLLARAGYTDAPILLVSSQTGEGIDSLRDRIHAKAATWTPRSAEGGFRLSVDRVFLVAGTGLVVTGTVAAGQVTVGDRLVVTPSRLAVRVRGVQRHHAAAESAAAGDRCALALAGTRVERSRIHRGDWVVAAHLHTLTRRLDLRMRAVDDRPLRHGSRVHAHLGAASIPGRVLVNGGADLAAGDTGFVNLSLERATSTVVGDRIVLRDTASGRVVAGGTVIDPFPPERRVRRDIRLASLEAQAHPNPTDALGALLAAEGWIDLSRFAIARNLDLDHAVALTHGLGAARIGRESHPVLVSAAMQATIADWLLRRLGDWHARHPDLPGPTRAALLAGAAMAPAEVIEAVLLDLLMRGEVERRDAIMCLPGHQPRMSDADQAAWGQVEPLLDKAGIRPPRVRELAVELGMDPDAAEALMSRLERFGLLLRVAPNRFFLPKTIIELGHMAGALADDSEEGGFTAAAFNQKSGIGRNLTIQVVEYLDRIGVTQRNGELRHILRPVAEVMG